MGLGAREWGDLMWYKFKKDLVAAAILSDKELAKWKKDRSDLRKESSEIAKLKLLNENKKWKGIVWKRVERKIIITKTSKSVAKSVNYSKVVNTAFIRL